MSAIQLQQINDHIFTSSTHLPQIAKAIDMAQKKGGGVVYFPPGRYFMGRDKSSMMAPDAFFHITQSNIVIRGAGYACMLTVILTCVSCGIYVTVHNELRCKIGFLVPSRIFLAYLLLT